MANDQNRSCWDPVKNIMSKAENVTFGKHISYWFRKSPRRALHSMSYYKFASRMIGINKSVLDIGCGEGLGTWLLAKECGQATGIDLDTEAIAIAKTNWKDPVISFVNDDFISGTVLSTYDGIVNFDVIEHIHPDHVDSFLRKICASLTDTGVLVIGTPNLYSQQFASVVTRAGHINVYTPERLESQMRTYFRNVFLFSANDELVHTGYAQLAHYLIILCCNRRNLTEGK